MFPNTPMQSPQHPEVQAALREIRIFSSQMQEFTTLFARSQSDMARQLEATTFRLDKAVETVAMGEARIAAQIGSFERMANEMRRIAEERDRTLKGVIESFQNGTADLAAKAMEPFKTEVASVANSIADAKAQIATVSSGFSSALETAVGAMQSRTERAVHQQLDALTDFVRVSLKDSESKFSSASEIFDHAAGALAQRLWGVVEAQDAKLGNLEGLSEKLDLITGSAAAQEHLLAKLANAEAAVSTLEDASRSVSLTSSTIVSALAEFKAEKELLPSRDDKTSERLEVIAADQSKLHGAITTLSGLLETAIFKSSAERGEAVTEMLQRLDGLHELVISHQPLVQVAASTLPPLSDEKDSLQRILTGFKLLLRDINGEAERLRLSVDKVEIQNREPQQDTRSEPQERVERSIGAIADAIIALDRKIEAINLTAQSAPVIETSANALPAFASERESVQRLVIGFRLLMRDIGSESERLRAAVDGLSGQSVQAQPHNASDNQSALVTGKLEEGFALLQSSMERLDAKIETMKPGEVEQAAAIVDHIKPMPPFVEHDKTSLQRLLVGFRHLLQEISAETTTYREKVAGIRQPETLILSPSIEAETLAPLHAAAQRIAEGVAETLASLEHKLAEPVIRLNDAVAGNVETLRLAHAAMAAPVPVNAASQGARDVDTVNDAVARMERAAGSIDERIGHVDQLLLVLRKGGAINADSLRDLVVDLEAAAGIFRNEAGDFLAIGAALSRELETSITASEAASNPRRARPAQNTKKKVS